MEVRKKVTPNDRFAIGLRLGAEAQGNYQIIIKFLISGDGLIKMMPMYLPSMDSLW